MAFWPSGARPSSSWLALGLVCVLPAVWWACFKPPFQSEVISSRLELRAGTIHDDFYHEWWERKQQELRLCSSNSNNANSTLLGGPLQAVCLAHGVKPRELGYASSAEAGTGFEHPVGVCLLKAGALADLWCCDPSEADAAQAAAHLAAAAQRAAPHDEINDHVQPHLLSTGSAVHEESDATSAQLADAVGALPSAPSTEDRQQPSLQAAVLVPDSIGGAGVDPAPALEVLAAAGLQGAPAEALNSSALAASAAAQALEANTGPQQHGQTSPNTGLSTEGLDNQHAAAPSTAQDTWHASTTLTETDSAGGFSTGLAADVVQLSAMQSLANFTSKLGAYSAQLWGKVASREPAAAGAHATVCDQHQGLRGAYQPAAAGEECSALQGDAAAGAQEVLQELEQQQQEEGTAHQAAAPGASLHSVVPTGAFLTPDMVLHAYKHMGLLQSVAFALCTVAVAVAIRYVWGKIVRRFAKKRTGLDGLPRSIRQDPKAVEAFCTLRDLCFQRKAWFRLVGVSGVAVYKATGAQLQAANIARRAEGCASFARGLLRQQRQRMLLERDALAAELREAFAEQLAERDAAHAAVVGQHVQKQEQQAALILQQSSERADLKSQLRQEKEDVAAQKAVVKQLEKGLEKAEDGKQLVQQEFDMYKQSMAKEEGRQEALQHKLQEGVERERVLASKMEDLQQRLSQAHSTISHLQAEVQHKDEAIAVHDASKKLLDGDKQQLQRDKTQLQQQVTAVTHERDDARSQAAALQEGKDQLQQRVTDLQLEVTSLQALHGQQAQQLQGGQNRCDALQQACAQLRADLAAAGERESQLSCKVQEQQLLLEDSSKRAQELQAQLDGERNQHDQTRIKLQHEVVQRQTAEESLRNEREEKHAIGSKADGLQIQLTSTTQELAQLNTVHASTLQTLQHVQQDVAELSQQHTAAQNTICTNEQQIAELRESLRQRDRQLSLQDQQKTEDDEQIRQLQQQLTDLQQQLSAREQEVEEHQVNIEQLIKLELEERGKLADCRKELQAVNAEYDFAQERISVLYAQLLEKQQEADELERQCVEQQSREVQLRADLELQKLSLEEAQRDLNENLDKYAEEDRKNRELGAENGKLQRAVLNLTEHKRQLDEELDELDESFEQLSARHERLHEQLGALESASSGFNAERDALLQESLQKSTQQQEKLKEAEAEVSGLRCQRDDLEKKLYWAEMSRDQTRAAKEMAAEDALKARQALTEEKLRKTVARTMSTPSGRGAVAASAAAAGDGSSARPWLRSNSSVPAKRWGTVEPAYLHQHFKDPKDGTVRRCGSPTRSHSNSESTPGTPRSTATSGDGGSTQRSRGLLRPTSSNASAAVQQLEGAFEEVGADTVAAAGVAGSSPQAQSVASEGSPPGSLASARLRRVPPGGSPRSRLQECSGPEQQQQGPGPAEDVRQEQQQQGRLKLQRSSSGSAGSIAASSSGSAPPSPGRTVAAAAAGLRGAFSDTSGSVAGPAAAAAAASAAAEGATTAADTASAEASAAAVDVQRDSPHADEQQQQLWQSAGAQTADALDVGRAELQQGQEASPGPASTATATPPLEQGGRSPSLCSSGTKSRLGFADMRDMRPLALSPVQQSSDLVLIGHDADSPGVSFSSRLAAADAAATAAAASIPDAAAAAGATSAGDSPVGGQVASLAGAGLTGADAVGGGGVLSSVASAVSAPGTPAAAAATAAGAASPAGSREGAEGGQLFFTPLPAAHSSGSSSSIADCCSPVFAAAQGSCAQSLTPYFTPAHGTAAAAAAAAAASTRAVPDAAAARAPASHAVSAAVEPVSCADAGAGQTQPDAAAGRSGSIEWLQQLPVGASPSSSPPSFSLHADDGDVVLIGSLSESGFAGLGLGIGNSSSSAAFCQQEHMPLDAAQQPPTDSTAAAAPPPLSAVQQRQQPQPVWEVGEWHQEDAEGSIGGSSRASSAAGSQAQSVSLANARGSNDCEPSSRAAAVPRLPLFQLHAAASAECADGATSLPGGLSELGTLPTGDSSATGPAIGAGKDAYDWDVDSDDDESASIASSAAAAAAAEEDADAGDSGQEDTAVTSDVDATPAKMFIGNMSAAAAAVAAAAAAASAGSGMHSPRTVQHSPRYQDQRAMHSPRYSNQQQQQQSPRYASQQQPEQKAAALGADADGSASSDVLAGGSAMPDTAPRSKPASPTTAASADARSSKGLRSSRGSPGSSPKRPISAGGAGSPPSAGAAAAGGGASSLKYPRRASRLSDPASSSCSSIRSLVAHSRQQQQLRRTGSNSSIGSAGGGAFMSVLGAVGGSPGVLRRSGSLDQQGFAKSLGLKQQQQQQQQGRSRRGSPNSSPNKSCIAHSSTGAGTAAAAASEGSRDSLAGLLQQSQSCRQIFSSSQDQPQQQRQQLHSPVGTCSPQPSAANLTGFSTLSGPESRAVRPATVGPTAEHRSTVMWKSLDDFVHLNRATSSSANSSPGNRRGGCGIGSSSMAGLPPFLSPPAAVLVNPWSSPPAGNVQQGAMQPPVAPSGARASSSLSPQASVAALQAALLPPGVSNGRASSNLSPQGSAAALQGLVPAVPLGGHSTRRSSCSLSPQGSAAALPQVLPAAIVSARGSYSFCPQGSVRGMLGSPGPVTPAAATGAAAVGGAPVLPVAEGVCDCASDADSPNSCISGESAAAGVGAEEGHGDAWTVQENPVYFELH